MRKYTYQIIFVCLIILPLINIPLLYLPLKDTKFKNDLDPTYVIKLSGSAIDIFTPKNNTYVKPMHGYYSGTDGFEHDEIGNEPKWFETVFTDGGTAKVIDTLEDHHKILELYDSSESNNTYVAKTLFALPTFGTIEYWVSTDDADKLCGFHLGGGAVLADLVTIRSISNKFQCWNGTSWYNITDIQSDKWYNIRIDFECSAGGYQGLSQYEWALYIDGIMYGNYAFANNRSFASVVMFYTDYLFGLSDYSYFLDAIGFSWDQFYTVGDNMNCGILLNFKAPSNLTWIGYSLDGNSNRTILGPFVLPFPNGNGIHKIQVFGTDSEDNIYQSDDRYFEINKPSLLLVHGMGGQGSPTFDDFYTYKSDWNRNGISDYIDYYGVENMIALESYYDNKTTRPEFDGIAHPWSPIENISRALKNYIIHEHSSGILKDNLDLIGYSLGGLVTRYMIKEYYFEIRQEGITIQHLGILGTPNHGDWGDNKNYLNISKTANFWYYESTKNCKVGLEMVSISDFLTELNADDETPYNIIYNTYRGTGIPDPFYHGGWFLTPNLTLKYIPGIIQNMEDYNATLINQLALKLSIYGDMVVPSGSVPLTGAVNNRAYPFVIHGGEIGNLTGLNRVGRVLRHVLWDLRYYLAPGMEIEFPQNRTYNRATQGYYLATNGFEHDENGHKPQWFENIFTEGGTTRVIPSLEDHYKVLELHDTSNINNTYVTKILYSLPAFGTIEYWMRTDDAEKLCGFHLNGGVILNDLVTIRTKSNKFQYWDGLNWYNITDSQEDKWYNIRIDFECSSGGYHGLGQYEWRLYINGIVYGDFPFANNRNFATVIKFYTDYLFGLSDYSYFIDAIGLSWDSNYNIGDNANEGLLLSCIMNFQPEWIKYSLDGSNNVTTLGDKAILLPSEGPHSIQVFSKEIYGEEVESQIVNFSIDTIVPHITINSPNPSDVFGITTPSFNLSIIESNLNAMWYTLDGGVTNVTFYDFIGEIDSTIWDSIPSGEVTIRFYANDIVGNVGYADLIIIKEIPEPEPAIPGYNIIIIICLISVIYLTFIKNKFKNYS